MFDKSGFKMFVTGQPLYAFKYETISFKFFTFTVEKVNDIDDSFCKASIPMRFTCTCIYIPRFLCPAVTLLTCYCTNTL